MKTPKEQLDELVEKYNSLDCETCDNFKQELGQLIDEMAEILEQYPELGPVKLKEHKNINI